MSAAGIAQALRTLRDAGWRLPPALTPANSDLTSAFVETWAKGLEGISDEALTVAADELVRTTDSFPTLHAFRMVARRIERSLEPRAILTEYAGAANCVVPRAEAAERVRRIRERMAATSGPLADEMLHAVEAAVRVERGS